MNAKETLIQYGNELKARSNTSLKNESAEYIMGKAMVEGVCFRRDGNSRMSCRMYRNGNIITVTETKKYEVNEVVDKRLVMREVEETSTVLTVEL